MTKISKLIRAKDSKLRFASLGVFVIIVNGYLLTNQFITNC